MRARSAPMALFFALSACSVVAGIDGEYRETSGVECRCVPSPGVGFSLPFILHDSNDAFECPAEYPIPVAGGAPLYGAPLRADPASCDCECVPPKDPCQEITLTLHDTCIEFGTTFQTLEQGVCKPFQVPASTKLSLPSIAPAGECTPKPTTTIPDLVWATTVRGCAAAPSSNACTGQDACLPPVPSGFSLCVRSAGDVPCRSADYPKKQLYFSGAEDTRGCSACNCGALGGDCGARILYTENCALGPALGFQFEDSCVDPSAAVAGATYLPLPKKIACLPEPGTPIGDATASGVVTICCAPAE